MLKFLFPTLISTSIILGCAQPQPASQSLDETASCPAHAHNVEFNSALAIFRKAKFHEARVAFEAYIKNFPSDPLLLNAYFWKGNAEYALGKYGDAIESLSKVTAGSYHRYTADAMLIIGSIQVESGEHSSGQKTLEKIIERYADSESAAKAREKLGRPFANPKSNSAARVGYAIQVANAIRHKIIYTPEKPLNPMAEITIRTGCYGEILDSKITRASESSEWDRAVLRAIERTSHLPRDVDGLVPPVLIIQFRSR